MRERLRDLFTMFYPLDGADLRRWAATLALPEQEYVSALAREAEAHGLGQMVLGDAVAWTADDGTQLMLLFRITDPRDLAAVRRVYDTIAANTAPLAYTFVQQLPDGEGTWDIFHMSKLSYLAHCNRVSGPGAEC
ncbi:MAG: hypothetical protein AMS20_14385 [Gemmatimonas sp. SG8_28]|nr:MAG: hypothetical protein AMS20_14385 [Gemmatimonas sp. SG8_28]